MIRQRVPHSVAGSSVCRIPREAAAALILTAIGLTGSTARPAEQPERRPTASAASAKSPDLSKLVGTWKLVAIEERNAQGELVTPLDYGPDPVGLLIYDTTGHMSVHAMRRGRAKLPSDDVHLAAPEQAKSAFVGYGAYFGTYEVDERAGIVIHHVEGSLIPNWEGSAQRRRFTLSGDKLTLEPPEIQAGGEKRTRRLTWQRVP
jgi:hypothetical protein